MKTHTFFVTDIETLEPKAVRMTCAKARKDKRRMFNSSQEAADFARRLRAEYAKENFQPKRNRSAAS